MTKQLIVLLSLVGVLAFGFTCVLQADEPKPATKLLETDVMIVEEEEAAIDEESKAEAMNIAERTLRFARLKTLVRALRTADLVESLREKGPFTFFAPNDEAFAKLPDGALERLLADREKLRLVLRYHIVPLRITADTAGQFATVETLQGNELRIDVTDGIRVNDARVVESDILGINGVIHVIDSVLLPEGEEFSWMESEEEKEVEVKESEKKELEVEEVEVKEVEVEEVEERLEY